MKFEEAIVHARNGKIIYIKRGDEFCFYQVVSQELFGHKLPNKLIRVKLKMNSNLIFELHHDELESPFLMITGMEILDDKWKVYEE